MYPLCLPKISFIFFLSTIVPFFLFFLLPFLPVFFHFFPLLGTPVQYLKAVRRRNSLLIFTIDIKHFHIKYCISCSVLVNTHNQFENVPSILSLLRFLVTNFVCVCMCVLLGMKSRALHMWGKHSTTELHAQYEFFLQKNAAFWSLFVYLLRWSMNFLLFFYL
jgi:hypothetical protein